MLKEKKDIDTVFSDGLSGYEVTPGEYVWESLDKKLNGQKTHRRTLLIWRSVAAACLIGLLLLSIRLFYNVSEPYVNTDPVVENNQESESRVGDKNIEDSNLIASTREEKEEIKELSSSDANNLIIYGNSNESAGLIEVLQGVKKSEFKLLASNKTVGLQHEYHIDKQLHVKVERKYYPLYPSPLESQKNRKKATITLGGVISPAYNCKVSNGSNEMLSNANMNINESGINSLGGGLQVRVQTNSRWSFESGILYAQIGQEVNSPNNARSFNEAFSQAQKAKSIEYANSLGAIVGGGNKQPMALSDNMSFVENTSFSSINSIKQTVGYIEIPMLARYTLFEQFPYLTFAGGLSTNFLVDNSAYSIDNGSKQKIGETSDIKSFVLSSSVGVGVDVPLTKMIRLNLEPRFKYFLNSISSSDVYEFQPYSFGIYGGVTFVIR